MENTTSRNELNNVQNELNSAEWMFESEDNLVAVYSLETGKFLRFEEVR
jgi:hypothetical protein